MNQWGLCFMKNMIGASSYANNMELLRAYKDGDFSLKNTIITNNLRLIYSIAHYYESRLRIFTFDDLVSEGVLALNRAIDTYSLESDTSFSTYATSCIKGYIRKFIQENDNSFYLSPKYNKELKLYRELVAEYKERGETLSSDIVCKKLNITLKHFKELSRFFSLQVLSIHQPLNDESLDSLSLGDVISDTYSFEDAFCDMRDNSFFLLGLKVYFSPFQYYIIFHRMIRNSAKTLEEIGNLFQVERESVRLWENKLKDDLKDYLVNKRKDNEKKVQVKYGKVLSSVNYLPSSLENSMRYYFISSYLTPLEKEFYQLKYLYSHSFTSRDYCECLGISMEEVKETCLSLQQKIEFYFQSSYYLKFKKIFSFKELHGITSNPSDCGFLNTLFQLVLLDFDELLFYFQDLNIKDADKQLLKDYFDFCNSSECREFGKRRRVYKILMKLDERRRKVSTLSRRK